MSEQHDTTKLTEIISQLADASRPAILQEGETQP